MAFPPQGPFKLVTVNSKPERAQRLIGRLTEDIKDQYIIDYIGNCIGLDEVEAKVKELKPDLLFCASMWTAEQSQGVFEVARGINPDIRTHAIPYGLQVEKGPDAIVEHLREQVPKLLASST